MRRGATGSIGIVGLAAMLAATGCAGLAHSDQAAQNSAPVLPDRGAVEALLAEHDIPGIAVATIDDGEVAGIMTVGLRDIENDLPLTEETVMAGMSWTKFVFAAYVAELAHRGRIDLDRPIGDYLSRPLPEYERYADLAGDDRWRDLTLRLLLSHRSGLPNFRFFPPNSDFDADAPLAFFQDPGASYGYSGEGFQIAQLVVAEALDLDIEPDLEATLFAPLGLERIGLRWKETFLSDYDIAYGEDGERIGHDARPEFDAAGSINGSIADFASLYAAIVDARVIAPEARAMLLTSQAPIRSAHQFPPWSDARDPALADIDLSAGLGAVLWTGRQGRGFFKGGHDVGGDSMLVCLIEQRDCVLLMTNIPRGHLVFPQLVESILGPTDLPWQWEYPQLDAADAE